MNGLRLSAQYLTRLSEARELRARKRAAERMARSLPMWVSVIQRVTLAGGLALSSSGCFLSSPPDLGEPDRTRPNLFDLTPANTQFIRLSSGMDIVFAARVQSEDAGVGLVAHLYLNYDTKEPKPQFVRAEEPPSTLRDTSRVMRITWRPLSEHAGCQQVTMEVTHSDNLGGVSGFEPLNDNDVGLATWWIQVDGDSTVSLDDCPSNVGPQQ